MTESKWHWVCQTRKTKNQTKNIFFSDLKHKKYFNLPIAALALPA